MNNLLDISIPLIVHYILSKQQITWLGVIIPGLYITSILYLCLANHLDVTTAMLGATTLGLIILLSVWSEGHHSFKKKP